MTSILPIKNWEDLQKQARHLENEIDGKLVSLSKLVTNINSIYSNEASVPLLDEEHVFEYMTSEIESILSKLVLTNEEMSEIHVCNAAMLHTIQRHKEILKDYRIEFNKTRSNFLAKRARDELLQNDSNGKNYDSDNGMNRRDYYFKENQHIYNSDSLINDQISIAIEARDHLISQRHTFKRIQTRFNDVSNRFPAINSLMQRVNLRKRRDSIILGLLVAFCTLLMLLYVFH